MPRQSRGPARAPPRPTVPAANQRPAAPQQQQTRPATTAAYPPAQQRGAQPQQATQQQGQSPGLFGQMASTAAGVAVGSSIGHALGGWFGGSSASAEAPLAPADQPLAQSDGMQGTMNQNYNPPKVCETDVTNFRRCMDENQGSLTICGWYLDQLKACQQAASRY